MFLIDFGVLVDVPVESLRELTPQFHKHGPFAFLCHLDNLQPAGDITKWSATSTDFLKDTVTCHDIAFINKKVRVVFLVL